MTLVEVNPYESPAACGDCENSSLNGWGKNLACGFAAQLVMHLTACISWYFESVVYQKDISPITLVLVLGIQGLTVFAFLFIAAVDELAKEQE